MQLSASYIHPVKSCAALACAGLDIESRGPRHDRRFMLVDGDARFVSGRSQPRMVLISARIEQSILHLTAPGMPALAVAAPAESAPRLQVRVWKDAVTAPVAGAEADEWFSRFLGTPVRLVHMDDAARRPLSGERGEVDREVSFADAYPLLLIGQASLDALNARLPVPVTMSRFRPNLVVSGAAPHAEDGWRRIRIGELEFDVVKPCTRCVFTSVDPLSAERDPNGEPLATLRRYRRGPHGVTFGMNLVARGTGRLRLGDGVEVLDAADVAAADVRASQ